MGTKCSQNQMLQLRGDSLTPTSHLVAFIHKSGPEGCFKISHISTLSTFEPKNVVNETSATKTLWTTAVVAMDAFKARTGTCRAYNWPCRVKLGLPQSFTKLKIGADSSQPTLEVQRCPETTMQPSVPWNLWNSCPFWHFYLLYTDHLNGRRASSIFSHVG